MVMLNRQGSVGDLYGLCGGFANLGKSAPFRQPHERVLAESFVCVDVSL